jgi:hypothetical protein
VESIGALEALGVGLGAENKGDAAPEIVMELPPDRHMGSDRGFRRVRGAQLARLAKHGSYGNAFFLNCRIRA